MASIPGSETVQPRVSILPLQLEAFFPYPFLFTLTQSLFQPVGYSCTFALPTYSQTTFWIRHLGLSSAILSFTIMHYLHSLHFCPVSFFPACPILRYHLLSDFKYTLSASPHSQVLVATLASLSSTPKTSVPVSVLSAFKINTPKKRECVGKHNY